MPVLSTICATTVVRECVYFELALVEDVDDDDDDDDEEEEANTFANRALVCDQTTGAAVALLYILN